MKIEIHFSDRFYAIFERVARSLESIDKTLTPPPDDFSAEDASVAEATRAVREAQERIPRTKQTTN